MTPARNFVLLSVLPLAALTAQRNAAADHPHKAPGVTSLTNQAVKYRVSEFNSIALKRDGVTAVIVTNTAVNNRYLRKHHKGYNGVGLLTHKRQPRNIFKPRLAGMNFEHIHDGRKTLPERFEPRKFPMQLRLIDDYTVELYQPPTGNYKLESCGRYQLLPGGVIEYTFECIPRADTFRNNTIMLFWASYIHDPEDKGIHFEAAPRNDPAAYGKWMKTLSPAHGVDSTHPPAGELPALQIDTGFPLTLVNHRSKYVHLQPWYYGVCRNMALAYLFRPRDRIWFAQSPTGGGGGNPAWDWQWFVPNARKGEAYGYVMRALYTPFTTQKALQTQAVPHLKALAN